MSAWLSVPVLHMAGYVVMQGLHTLGEIQTQYHSYTDDIKTDI